MLGTGAVEAANRRAAAAEKSAEDRGAALEVAIKRASLAEKSAADAATALEQLTDSTAGNQHELGVARRELATAREELEGLAESMQTLTDRAERAEKTASDRSTELTAATERAKLAEKAAEARSEELEAAAMQVSLAEKSTAQVVEALDKLSEEHTDKLREVETARVMLLAAREELERQGDSISGLTERAEVAERSHKEQSTELDQARTAAAASKTRIADLEAQLSRVRGEQAKALAALEAKHLEMVSALRAEQAAANRDAAHAIEHERATSAQLTQKLTVAEGAVANTRNWMANVANVLDEISRREEMATAVRTRSLEQAMKLVTNDPTTGAAPQRGGPPPPPPPGSAPSKAKDPKKKPPLPASADPTVEVLSFEDLEGEGRLTKEQE